jgi:hypothetical protein
MRLNFLSAVFATVAGCLCAFGLLAIPTPTLASTLFVGAPADGENCHALGCTPYHSSSKQAPSANKFPGTMTLNGLTLYPTMPDAEVVDDAALVKGLETGVVAENPSPGEGLLCIALVLGLGLAARFQGLFV